VALDPEVRQAFEAAGERVVRVTLNRRHPAVREWLQEKEAARARARGLKRKLVRSLLLALFFGAAATVTLVAFFGNADPVPNAAATAEASLPSQANPDAPP
jgi:hypothetical protein